MSTSLALKSLPSINPLSLSYERAKATDCSAIDALMGTEGVIDFQKIVILPNKFRTGAIESLIKAGRLFVARHNESVIGFKKLYTLNDAHERIDMLKNEIRCIDGALIDAYALDALAFRVKLIDFTPFSFKDNDLCIYDGADFTKNEFRGIGVNSELTRKAFDLIREDVEKIKHRDRIVLLYGLTYLNDYDEKGEGKSRTPAIVKVFASFIRDLNGTYPEKLFHYRYKAFMPTFDLDSDECNPRPDSASVPGYGNVLIADLSS